jgi:neurofibromin 1
MICNILHFLDASPMTLFEGPPSEGAERNRFFLDNFSSIISCVVAANESIRRLAAGVARRLFREGTVLKLLREFGALDSLGFKSSFWRLRYGYIKDRVKRPVADRAIVHLCCPLSAIDWDCRLALLH